MVTRTTTMMSRTMTMSRTMMMSRTTTMSKTTTMSRSSTKVMGKIVSAAQNQSNCVNFCSIF